MVEATGDETGLSIVRTSINGAFAAGDVAAPVRAGACGRLSPFRLASDRNFTFAGFEIAFSGVNAATFRRRLADFDFPKIVVLSAFFAAPFGRARADFSGRAAALALKALRIGLEAADLFRVLAVALGFFRDPRAPVRALARAPRFLASAAEGCPEARFRAERAAAVARFVFIALELLVLLVDFLRVVIVTLHARPIQTLLFEPLRHQTSKSVETPEPPFQRLAAFETTLLTSHLS